VIQAKELSLNERRKLLRRLAIDNAGYPEHLVPLPREQWPYSGDRILEAWRSRRFVLTVYAEADGVERLSIVRAMFDEHTGEWLENIDWTDLQSLKAQCGRGDKFAVEIFPADADLVNVANMRHLWVLPEPPSYGWRRPTQA
jgi:hypothetical protein